MHIKTKIISSILFITLAILLTIVGVWAVTDTNFKVTGDINYTAPEQTDLELLYNSTYNYYYLEMGMTGETRTAVRWILVSIDGETKFNATSTPPTLYKGQIGYFIFDSDYWISKTTVWTDYAVSEVRTYLTSIGTGYFMASFNISETNAIYQKIAPREISSLYKDIKYNQTTGLISDVSTEATGADKFWLPSVKEIYTLVGGGTVTDNKILSSAWTQDISDNLSWPSAFPSEYRPYYALRSPDEESGLAWIIRPDGTLSVGEAPEFAIRPMTCITF